MRAYVGAVENLYLILAAIKSLFTFLNERCEVIFLHLSRLSEYKERICELYFVHRYERETTLGDIEGIPADGPAPVDLIPWNIPPFFAYEGVIAHPSVISEGKDGMCGGVAGEKFHTLGVLLYGNPFDYWETFRNPYPGELMPIFCLVVRIVYAGDNEDTKARHEQEVG